MKQFKYISYGGPEDYIFIRCHSHDAKRIIPFVNELIDKEIRVYFDCADSKDEHSPAEISAAIKNAELCIFALSPEALEDLDFRNSINFAFTNYKRLLCFRLTDKDLGHGMDMQLANVPMFKNENDLLNAILNDEHNDRFTGEGQKQIEENTTRKIMTFVLLTLSLIFLFIFGYAIIDRINYNNSPEYQLSNLEDIQYLDFTSYSNEDLVYLSGKNIDYIDFRNMHLSSLNGIEDIGVKEINISNNPELTTIEPILASDSIEIVHLSQDMLEYADALYDRGIEVVIDG